MDLIIINKFSRRTPLLVYVAQYNTSSLKMATCIPTSMTSSSEALTTPTIHNKFRAREE